MHASSASARSAAEADVARHDEIEEAVKSHDVQKAKLGRRAVDLERKAVKLREELEGKTVRAGAPTKAAAYAHLLERAPSRALRLMRRARISRACTARLNPTERRDHSHREA